MTGDRPSINTLHQDLQPVLLTLEAQRIRVRNRALISGAIMLAIVAIAAFAFWSSGNIIGMIVGLVVGIAIWIMINIKPIQAYRTQFKQHVIHRLVQHYDPELRYTYNDGIAKVEARYILSTSLMQRLLDFRSRMGSEVALSFINSCVYIAIPTSKNYFEPPSLWVGSVMITVQAMQDYFNDIRLAQEIIQDLNLNLRIWGKH